MEFEDIYNGYWQKIFRLCMGYTNDPEWAKDITQETFVVVWQQLPNFRNESGVGTWIYRIATNNCLRQIEKSNRYPRSEVPIHLSDEKPTDMEPQIRLLYKYISELPETERIIISMELENIKQSEIASILGISEVNIRVKIHRIKERLKQKFKENEQR